MNLPCRRVGGPAVERWVPLVPAAAGWPGRPGVRARAGDPLVRGYPSADGVRRPQSRTADGSVGRVAWGDVKGLVQRQQRSSVARKVFRRFRSEQEADVVAAVEPGFHAADEPGGGLVEDQ